VSQILQTDWKFLTDDQFQKVSLKKHINFWMSIYRCDQNNNKFAPFFYKIKPPSTITAPRQWNNSSKHSIALHFPICPYKTN
jgi:hypothetical protein